MNNKSEELRPLGPRSFTEMIEIIKTYRQPSTSAFVTIWWWDRSEALLLIQLLKNIGYKVTSFMLHGETEIRFSQRNMRWSKPLIEAVADNR